MNTNMAIVKFETIPFLHKLISMDLYQRETLLKGGTLELHEFYFVSKDNKNLVHASINISHSSARIGIQITRMEEVKPFAINNINYFNEPSEITEIRTVLSKLMSKYRHQKAEVLSLISEKIKYEQFLKTL
jgi:hypothetical protein